jgi:predicted Zn finger-like uncharacterized protein
VIIECTSCHARYKYDEDRFERKPSKKIKCAKCSTVFEIHNPAFAAKKPASDVESTAARHDSTNIRRAKPDVEDDTGPAEPQHDTSKSVPEQKLPEGKRLSIAIIDGNDAGNVFRIDKPHMTIGRSNADIVINDTEASRQHAAIEVRDTIYLLHDLSSTNGTRVDGKKITEATELPDKGEFQIGSTTLMLIVTEES